MTMIIDGTNGLTFNNASTQASAGLTSSSTQVCQAWVNFNGTVATPSTIRASYNVSSVTRNSTGNFTVNFTSALVDANYAGIVMSGSPAVADTLQSISGSNPTSSSFSFVCRDYSATTANPVYVNVAIFR